MPRFARCGALVAFLTCGAVGFSEAQGCTAPEHRQFDFWVGDWDVSNPAGKPAGRNRIEPILGGCALRETWTGAGGSRGHQTWVDNGGLVLRLDGEFAGGKMVLSGETLDSTGTTVLNRITWQQMAPGAVRQLWEVSMDRGKTWRTVFDGRYRKR
jgi:hypothetical protein